MSENKIVRAWAESIRKKLIAQYEKDGLEASGSWAQALKFNVKSGALRTRITYTGKSYTRFMIDGRGANLDQNPEALRAWVGWAGSTIFTKWLKDKGLSDKLNPYAVATKIAKFGINVPNKHNDGKLFAKVVTKQELNAVSRELFETGVVTIKSQFKNIR